MGSGTYVLHLQRSTPAHSRNHYFSVQSARPNETNTFSVVGNECMMLLAVAMFRSFIVWCMFLAGMVLCCRNSKYVHHVLNATKASTWDTLANCLERGMIAPTIPPKTNFALILSQRTCKIFVCFNNRYVFLMYFTNVWFCRVRSHSNYNFEFTVLGQSHTWSWSATPKSNVFRWHLVFWPKVNLRRQGVRSCSVWLFDAGLRRS